MPDDPITPKGSRPISSFPTKGIEKRTGLHLAGNDLTFVSGTGNDVLIVGVVDSTGKLILTGNKDSAVEEAAEALRETEFFLELDLAPTQKEKLQSLRERLKRIVQLRTQSGIQLLSAEPIKLDSNLEETAAKEQQESTRLGEEVKLLTAQNESLRMRIAELQEIINTQNAKLLRQQNRLSKDHEQVNDTVASQLASIDDSQLRMFETYDGEVQHVGENTVVVMYLVDGELVEQTYEKKQFKDGVLPAVSARVKVMVSVVEFEPKRPSEEAEENAHDKSGDKPSHRKPLEGPIDL